MKKILAILLGIALAAGSAYAASAWFVGKQVEASLVEPYKQFESPPYTRIVRRDFRRGVFTSTDTVTIELFGDMFRMMDQAQRHTGKPSREPLEPIQFTVRSRITHGPVPGLSTLAAAIVDSEVELNGRLRREMAKALGDRKILTAQTVVRHDGSGDSVIASPAFVATLADPDSGTSLNVAWEGLNATLQFTGGLESYASQGQAPKLEMTDEGGMRILMSGMRFRTTSKRIFKDEPLLYAGTQKLALAQMLVDGPALGGKPFALKQVTYDVNVPASGEFIDIIARIGVLEALVGGQNYGPAHYDFSLKHLHARTFARLQHAIVQVRNAGAQPVAGNPAEALGPLATPALKLLEHGPEISLDRLSFVTPQGEVLVVAKARLNDVQPEDASSLPALLAKLDAGADIALPEALLMTQFGPAPQTVEAVQMRQKQIVSFLEQGYIYRDGAMIKSKLEFRNGQFLVNGLPFDPMAAQSAPPPTANRIATPTRQPAKR